MVNTRAKIKKTHNTPNLEPTPKMVKTRAKIKKTHNTLNLYISKAGKADSDHPAMQSGALISSNDDLLTEILRRLPVTSILQFKSVSKHWRSLLSHCRFTHLYNKSSTPPGFFVFNLYIPFDFENRSAPPFRNLDFYPDRHGIKILQSCNGLLLCCSNGGSQRDRKYYIFNPTTKQFARIPPVPGKDVRKTICFMGLAYETNCVHYKVVCFHRPNRDEHLFHIQIYSSETGKWKISDESLSAPNYPPLDYGVYWNQAIHWASSCTHPSYFKLDTEELLSLPLPEGSLKCHYFGESRGHLHLVETADQSETHLHLNVYEMLDDHSGWFVKYRVEFDEVLDAYPEMIRTRLDPSSLGYYEFQLFDVVRGERDDETFMVMRIPGNKIIRYDVADKSFREIYNLSSFIDGPIDHSKVHRYIESIASF